jgi:predicted RNA methylase
MGPESAFAARSSAARNGAREVAAVEIDAQWVAVALAVKDRTANTMTFARASVLDD